MRITIDTGQIDRLTRRLMRARGGLPDVLMRALNRVTPGIKTGLKREIGQRYTLKRRAARVNAGIAYTRASAYLGRYVTRTHPTGKGGRRIGLFNFATTPRAAKGLAPRWRTRKSPKGRKRPTQGLKVNIKRGTGATRLQHVFAVPSRGGSVAAYERAGDERGGLERLAGPSIAQMMGNEEARRAIMPEIEARLAARLEHEAARLLDML